MVKVSRKKPPRWYFSLRSPFSWFAYRDLVERYPDIADRVEWIPFWEPDEVSQKLLDEAGVTLPIVPMSRAKNLYILQDTRRLALSRGWTMTWPIDREPNWEVSHLGYLVAQAEGAGREYVDLVYRARWEEGRDITSRDTIGQIAAELGLDAARVADASDDPEIRRQGADCLIRSSRDGLFGVPFFIRGHDRFFGVDRLKAYVAAMREEEMPEGAEHSWLDEDGPRTAGIPAFGTPVADAPAGGCG